MWARAPRSCGSVNDCFLPSVSVISNTRTPLGLCRSLHERSRPTFLEQFFLAAEISE